MSKVLLHISCDECGVTSYSGFTGDYPGMPPRRNGSTLQIEVRDYDGHFLCQPCQEEYFNTADDGARQLDMFGGE